MSILEITLLLLVACVCGSIAQALAGYSPGGCVVAIALGFIGAMLGSWLARALSLPELFMLRLGETSFPVIWSIAGATLFAAILSLFRGARRVPR